MIRRRFLGLLTGAGVAGAAAVTKATLSHGARETVTYEVKGFTCVTCATGLETLLGREEGVLAIRATYPDGLTKVSFNTRVVTEAKIRSAIEGMGFAAKRIDSVQG